MAGTDRESGDRPMRATRPVWGRLLLVALLLVSPVAAEPLQPQVWWPVQPAPLPFVHTLFSNDMVLQRDIAAGMTRA